MDWGFGAIVGFIVLAGFCIWVGGYIMGAIAVRDDCKPAYPIVIEHRVYKCFLMNLPVDQK